MSSSDFSVTSLQPIFDEKKNWQPHAFMMHHLLDRRRQQWRTI
jgi:hypothetical protein